jgi:hypothetical protein
MSAESALHGNFARSGRRPENRAMNPRRDGMASSAGWTRTGRKRHILAGMAPRSCTRFAGGAYLRWTVRGHVRIRVTQQAGPAAIISGLFLDPSS